MTKLNQAGRPASPLKGAAAPTGKTHEGAAGYERTPETELFMRATTVFAGEGQFYEEGRVADDRAIELVRQLAVDNWPWTAGFLLWLRNAGNIRTYSLMLAAHAVDAVATRPWAIPGG